MARPQPEPSTQQSPQSLLSLDQVDAFLETQRNNFLQAPDTVKREMLKAILQRTQDAQGLADTELNDWVEQTLIDKQFATPGPQITTGGTPQGAFQRFQHGALETAAAYPLPTLGEAAGGMLGSRLGGAGQVLGSMAGSEAGYLANVALGLEDLTVGGAATAALAPLAGRAVGAGTRQALKGTQAAKVVLGKQIKREMEMLKNEYRDTFLAAFPSVTMERYKTVLKQLDEAGEDLHKQLQQAALSTRRGQVIPAKDLLKSVPTTPLSTLQAMYDKLGKFTNITIPDALIRDTQEQITRANRLITTINPALQDAAINKIGTQAPTPDLPTSFTLPSGVVTTDPQIIQQYLPQNEVSFPAIWRTISRLGQEAQKLAGSKNPAAKGQRHAIYTLRDELTHSLENIAAQGGAGQHAVTMLRSTNSQYSKLMTVQEFGDFVADFVEDITETMVASGKSGSLQLGDKLFNARKALSALEEDTPYAQRLRDNLSTHGLLSQVRLGLGDLRRETQKAYQALAQTTEGRRGIARATQNIPQQPSPPPEQLAALEAQIPEVTLVPLHLIARGAYLVGALGTTSAGLGGGAHVPIATGLIAPWAISWMLTAFPASRKLLISTLRESNGLVDRKAMSTIGAFLGTTLRQVNDIMKPAPDQFSGQKLERPL